jgi:hypothetical protein
MRKVTSIRKWKVTLAVAVLLAVVSLGFLGVPVLLAMLMPARTELEPIMVDVASWQMYRSKLEPNHSLPIDEVIENCYSNNDTRMEIDVDLYDYVEDWDEIPFGKDKDGIVFKVNVTAAVAQGFESFFAVRFRTVDAYSTVYIGHQYGNVHGQYLATHNAIITDLRVVSKEWGGEDWINLGEAYVKAECNGMSSGLEGQIYWVFSDLNVENHQLEVILEFTYFNQTISQKIVVPIALNMNIST